MAIVCEREANRRDAIQNGFDFFKSNLSNSSNIFFQSSRCHIESERNAMEHTSISRGT